MANTIQIKRGASIPPDGSLAPYELGVKTPEMELYIGDSDAAAKPVIAKGNWETARSLAVYLSLEDI